MCSALVYNAHLDYLSLPAVSTEYSTMSTEEIPPNIAALAAPLLLGDFFHWGLFGILTVQVYIYYLAFPKDRTAFKCLVYGLYTVDMAQTLIVTHDAFFSYAKGFGSLSALDAMQTGWLAVPVLSGIVSCTVQLCYTYRIYVLSKSKVLVIGISALAVTQGSAAIAEGVQAFEAGRFSTLASKAFASTTVWLAGSAACDLIIAASMTFLVSGHSLALHYFMLKREQLRRKDSGMNATHALLSRLIRLIIETGCLTATMALVELSLFLAYPDMSYHVCIAVILAKLYSNSLLVVFNSRLRLANGRGGGSGAEASFISCSNFNSKNSPQTLALGTNSSRTMTTSFGGIQVEQERWTDNVELDSRDSESKKKTSILPLEA
ncbi:uncharacterized protein FOMMEDRAFT_170199 [Fomitiporia mediterranea MF3/22]|uniref:uncharacterized protein n=1 Tax=Fomitiporia mediterranea (strain MF3/22) TaxID=694068 RepID=UPI0004407BDA|nr:uncharacterized protein FOMMEDRAFT_170199 [Fomitiporia mediterranea MF3/22]EJD00212.1 hypothetical protein FOMMEDRAFT_170199 [Fomitiporia mediterranea MF3/22]